jgi:antitoxin (DNA-binding transcriptional repressor) of toxin-antitoxin stability system
VEKATVSKLKDNLSAYLRKVRAGPIAWRYSGLKA